jgi:elongation factor Ts
MEITTEAVKDLRDRTGVSVMQCKKALEEAEGDIAKAETILCKHSGAAAAKKSGRTLAAGTVSSYVHDRTIGAMVLLGAETDFVAKNPEFEKLAREIAMQVSAMDPENTEALLEQPYIKDESKKVQDLLNEATQKFGERVEITQFARFSARG